jgi:hypothetical protein
VGPLEGGHRHLASFEMYCWRMMEKNSWSDCVKNEEVFHRVKEERNILAIKS